MLYLVDNFRMVLVKNEMSEGLLSGPDPSPRPYQFSSAHYNSSKDHHDNSIAFLPCRLLVSSYPSS